MVPRTEDENRQYEARLPHIPQELESVTIGEAQVQYRDVELALTCEPQCIGRISGDIDCIPVLQQCRCYRARERFVIFYQQEPHTYSVYSRSATRTGSVRLGHGVR